MKNQNPVFKKSELLVPAEVILISFSVGFIFCALFQKRN